MMTLDEAALKAAREAREELLVRQRDAERARVDYHHEIRRLHAAGGSLREIADALGLSHQRVHQIVDAEEHPTNPETMLERVAAPMRRLRGGVGFRGFAEPARETVVAATEQARLRGSREIEARDLLDAMLREPDERTAAILMAAGVDAPALRQELPAAEGAGASSRKRLAFAASAKSALERGLREAMALRSNQIGREHLLLGILALDDPAVDQLLERAGTNREALRNAAVVTLGSEP
jgi:hypothetical protein